MGRTPALSDVEKGQITAYKDDGISSREISRRIHRSPSVVNNFLKLGLEYGTKKSSGIPLKVTQRQERCIWNLPGKVSSRSQHSCAQVYVVLSGVSKQTVNV